MDSHKNTQQLQELLQTAFREHQQGQFQSALDKYLQIIKTSPEHADALHLAGVIFLQANQTANAIDFISRATRSAPEHTDAWNNLGIAFFNKSNFEESIKAYKNCIKTNKNHFQAHNNLGNAYREINDHNNAIQHYRTAISLHPDYPEAHYNLGNTLKDIGKTEAAIKHYKKAIDLKPDYFEAYKNLGIVFTDTGNSSEAIPYYEIALQIDPQNPDIYHLCARSYYLAGELTSALEFIDKAIALQNTNPEYFNTRGTILSHLKKYEEAIHSFNKGLEIAPRNESIINNLGSTYKSDHQYHEAEKTFLEAISINPENYEALNNLGVVQRIIDKPDQAIISLEKSLSLYPDHISTGKDSDLTIAHIYNNLGLTYTSLMKFKEAHSAFEKALSSDKTYIEAKLSDAIVYLTEGNFEKGWEYYESRLQVKTRKDQFSGKLSTLPEWDNSESAINNPLVVLPEQGIGDEVMFASILPDLIRIQKAPVTVACDPRLVNIFQLSFNDICCKSTEEIGAAQTHRKIYIGSLTRFLRGTEKEFPASTGYLSADNSLQQHFSDKYAHLAGLKVGISWKSGNINEGNRRSIPLADLSRILSISNCQFFNLQYGDTSSELNQLSGTSGIQLINDDEIDPLSDMNTFFAICSTMDLIISIDNSTVHIAGALGIPTWVMLPYVCDWRWMRERSDSVWYPSLRLFRQDESKTWDCVLEAVEKDLNSMLHLKP